MEVDESDSMVEKLRILIVDGAADERATCRVLLDSDRQAAYELLEADCGARGCELLESWRPDCVLLDYDLLDLTGLEVLARMAGEGGRLVSPVVMLARGGSEKVAVDAMRAGASDYMQKAAVSTRSLGRALSNAVAKHRMQATIDEYRDHLERSNQDLRRRNEEIQGFYHQVSHELKTPLTSVKEFASILFDGIAGPVNDEQREYLGYIVQGCDDVARCLNDMLDVTRLETGKMSIDSEPRELAPLIARVVSTFEPSARRKDITLTSSVADGLPAVRIDETRVMQVLSNLVSNALKYTPRSGDVDVRAHVAGDGPHVFVSVRDTGLGIPRDKHERIFDRLFQVTSGSSGLHDTRIRTGLGLGLHLCRELVELHGGEIFLESDESVGSTFTFTLPRAS
jgi:signal transduction histidine kinase